jgi:hypothetical protein
MGLFSAISGVILVASVIGFTVGCIKALSAWNFSAWWMVLLGSAVGVYLGLLGIKVDELDKKSKGR